MDVSFDDSGSGAWEELGDTGWVVPADELD